MPVKTFLVLILCFFCFGCGNQEPAGNKHIQSPLSKQFSYNYANRLAMYSGGWVVLTKGRSMGEGVSDYAWVVLIDEWSLTDVNDVISWAKSEDYHVLHQVFIRDKDAIRTKGTGNLSPDWTTVYKENYEGTMIAQIYFRKELTD
jgi:hypothetical protein